MGRSLFSDIVYKVSYFPKSLSTATHIRKHANTGLFVLAIRQMAYIEGTTDERQGQILRTTFSVVTGSLGGSPPLKQSGKWVTRRGRHIPCRLPGPSPNALFAVLVFSSLKHFLNRNN